MGLSRSCASMEEYVAEFGRPVPPGGRSFHLVGSWEERLACVVQLKDRNVSQDRFPDSRYWLSGVYVVPEAREPRGLRAV